MVECGEVAGRDYKESGGNFMNNDNVDYFNYNDTFTVKHTSKIIKSYTLLSKFSLLYLDYIS